MDAVDSGSQAPGNGAAAAPRPLEVRRLGLRPYREVWSLQRELQAALVAGAPQDTLIVCRHPSVITLGRSAKESNVLAGAPELGRLGIERIEIERGGDVTYHGAGQVVAYPIVNLNFQRRDVAWYMRTLEEVVIRTIAAHGIAGIRAPGKTGVWVESCGGPLKKIASIGVRISRWCSMHGLALNVEPDPQGFALINPCGFRAEDMTSMRECLSAAAKTPAPELLSGQVEDLLVQCFSEVFRFRTLV